MPSLITHAAEQKRRRAEADEVAWLLGLQLCVQVIAGPGDSVRHILAGLLPPVLEAGLPLAEAAWSQEFPHRAALVVAAIGGREAEQTWDSFGRACMPRPKSVRRTARLSCARSCSANRDRL